ncbi:DUF6703 family protein [Spiractinospora alimapuensis]|uniref:DUF6703 family protein n=1 Tax=Spiractinospora alimapuensis TaxID=2820884 RepID=UPI002ED0A0E8
MSANGGGSPANGGAGLRRVVEEHSAPVLFWLHHAPRWLLPVAMAGVLIGGLYFSGLPGAALLGLLALFILWLAFIAWPTLRTPQRTLRCVVISILLVLAVAQISPF